MRRIKEIDKERNGYVTSTELDDIIKLSYGVELQGKSLLSIFKPYASIQNKILIDYKTFRDDILANIKKEKELIEVDPQKSRIVDILSQRHSESASKHHSKNIGQFKKLIDILRPA